MRRSAHLDLTAITLRRQASATRMSDIASKPGPCRVNLLPRSPGRKPSRSPPPQPARHHETFDLARSQQACPVGDAKKGLASSAGPTPNTRSFSPGLPDTAPGPPSSPPPGHDARQAWRRDPDLAWSIATRTSAGVTSRLVPPAPQSLDRLPRAAAGLGTPRRPKHLLPGFRRARGRHPRSRRCLPSVRRQPAPLFGQGGIPRSRRVSSGFQGQLADQRWHCRVIATCAPCR